MASPRHPTICVLLGAAWAAALVCGLWRLWKYEAAPGAAARAPVVWPNDARAAPRAAGLPTLVLLVHPRCPCSRATVGELAKLMAVCRGKLRATVLVLRPRMMPAGWERKDLWESAAAIPGTSVVADVDGAEARRFGAQTSGQALLFAADGRLLFAGGITKSRGHSGDNDGCLRIEGLVLHDDLAAEPARTPVYGCPLFSPFSACPKEGTATCPK